MLMKDYEYWPLSCQPHGRLFRALWVSQLGPELVKRKHDPVLENIASLFLAVERKKFSLDWMELATPHGKVIFAIIGKSFPIIGTRKKDARTDLRFTVHTLGLVEVRKTENKILRNF